MWEVLLQEGLAGHYPVTQVLVPGSGNGIHVPIEMGPQRPHRLSQSQAHTCQPDSWPTYSLSGNPPSVAPPHHHHRLPNRSPPSTKHRSDYNDEANDDEERDASSVVGQPGMPEPALKPRGPKVKFSPEDDILLVRLKETKNLTWKQIADFFPGRSSGTLQVRYCTKLKAKTIVWTEDTVRRCSTLEHQIQFADSLSYSTSARSSPSGYW